MGFDGASKRSGKNPILTCSEENNADILYLQKYASGESHQHLARKDIERELRDYPHHHIDVAGNDGDYSDKIICYSRLPILSIRALNYTSNYNGSVLYELKLDKDVVTLINNHLESNRLTKTDRNIYEDVLEVPEEEKVEGGVRLLVYRLVEASAIRTPQTDTITKEVASSRRPSIIICGDFSDTPVSYIHRAVVQNLNGTFTQSGRSLGVSYS